ncbi:hypothetical protein FGG78_24800 [Thioclava sp. BHET1]|nr:hypothetical protein FGG78_24800 [Thioclava sp. BHET1]
MSLTFPYTLSFLSDELPVESVLFSIFRNDELYGSGDGRVWTSQLAPPLWQATLNLFPVDAVGARRVSAKINALNGSQKTFLLSDPTSPGPASDPAGAAVSAMEISITTISDDRTQATFSGFTSGFRLTVGDRFTLVSGQRVYMGEIGQDATAAANGTVTVPVFPPIPASFPVDLAAEFRKPYFEAMLKPAAFTGWTISGGWVGSGASIDVIQKVR